MATSKRVPPESDTPWSLMIISVGKSGEEKQYQQWLERTAGTAIDATGFLETRIFQPYAGAREYIREICFETYEAISAPQRLASGAMSDDFCIDDENGAAYLTVHRENRIDCAAIEPDDEAVHRIAGKSLDEILLGPTSAACGRIPGEYRRVAHLPPAS